MLAPSPPQKPLLSALVRVVVGGKSRSPAAALLYCGHTLRHVTHEEFSGELVPALGRALLRSPELAVGHAAALLTGLTIDLSRYAEELGKPLSSEYCGLNTSLCRGEGNGLIWLTLI